MSKQIRTALPAAYVDHVVSSAEVERIAVINMVPEDGETSVAQNKPWQLLVCSLDAVALTAVDVFASVDGAAEESVYTLGGGFTAGYSGTLSSATARQSPGAGSNDELLLYIDPTTGPASESVITLRVSVETSVHSYEVSYTFTIEDLTAPAIDSILWITPRRCRLRFTEAMSTSSTLPGTLALTHIKGGIEIVDGSTIKLLTQSPSTTWNGYYLSLTGSAAVTNNRVFQITGVDVSNKEITVDVGNVDLAADTGVDRDVNDNVRRTRTLQLSVSPYKLTARLDEEGTDYPPDHELRVQCAYLPTPIAAQLPEEDEIPADDVQAQYVVLDFHDDISFGRLYTLQAKNVEDAADNTIDAAADDVDFTTPTFGAPVGRIQLWDLFPELVRRDDLETEAELRKMTVVLQDLFNSMWYRVDQMEHTNDPATAPAHTLDYLLHRHGNPFRWGLTTEQAKRRLLGQLRSMYRKLGTIGGMEAILEFFLEGVFDIEPFLTAGGWILNQGVLGYVDTGPPITEIQLDTMLSAGSAYMRNSYQVRSYRTLTAAERQIITEICEWADPANMHLAAIVEPGTTEGLTSWVLNSSILSSSTALST